MSDTQYDSTNSTARARAVEMLDVEDDDQRQQRMRMCFPLVHLAEVHEKVSVTVILPAHQHLTPTVLLTRCIQYVIDASSRRFSLDHHRLSCGARTSA